MLRRRLMKRLSKSASDISGPCRKKTYSTSPDEEHALEFPGAGGSHDEDNGETRPSSACSMPGGSGSGGHRHHSFGGPDRDEIIRTSGPSEIGIRTVSVVGYRSAGTAGSNSSGHHQVGLLSMLKQRFSTGGGGGGGSRSSSKESDHSSTKSRGHGAAMAPPNTENCNYSSPEVTRKRIVTVTSSVTSSARAESSSPEIVRFRRTADPVGGEDSDLYKPSKSDNDTVHSNSKSETPLDTPRNPPPTPQPGASRHVVIKAGSESSSDVKMKSDIVKKVTCSNNTSENRSKVLTQDQQQNGDPQSGPSSLPANFTGGGNGSGPAASGGSQSGPSSLLVNSTPKPQSDPTTADTALADPGVPEYPYYHVVIFLSHGSDLPAMDSCGTSDPYAKFYWKSKQVFKSKIVYKELNPVWDETFILAIDDPSIPVDIKVYDWDRVVRDDFIGECSVNLNDLDHNRTTTLTLNLTDPAKTATSDSGAAEAELGQITLDIQVLPKRTPQEHPKIGSTCTVPQAGGALTQGGTSEDRLDTGSVATAGADTGSITSLQSKNLKGGSGKWSAIANVLLVEGKDLPAMDFEGTSDPYCKFRLGNDRYKTKVIYETLCPKWLEQFDLNLVQDQSQELEVTVWDKDQRSKDDFMGKCTLDLSTYRHEETHELWVDLEGGAGKLHILLTITGRSSPELLNLTDLSNVRLEDEAELQRKFSARSSFSYAHINDIGYLEIRAFSARGLMAADLGGKSDPYAVFELDNAMLRTHTEYKTVAPVWNRALTLNIRDIHSVLFVTVYDEDRNHRSEFLGKIGIPLFKIDSGKRRWYALKDKKLRCRAKGSNPQIQLELTLYWNAVRAAVRTLNPKDKRYMDVAEKFKRQVFLNNVMRIKSVIMEFVAIAKFVESCLEWESPVRSVTAFIAYLAIVYYFQPYMLTIALLLLFIKNYLMPTDRPYLRRSQLDGGGDSVGGSMDDGDAGFEDVEDDDGKEEKKTLKAKLQAVQEVTATVQNAIGYVASLCEKAKNTFNFSVPFLSWLAIIILFFVTLVLYFISLRFLLIVWGVNKFTKKLIRPNYVPNNELLDFLSRVPDDEEILDYHEMRLQEDPVSSPSKGKGQGSGAKRKSKQS